MDLNFLRGIGTLLALLAFIGICLWAYSSNRKRDFDEAANLPFADDDQLTASKPQGERKQ